MDKRAPGISAWRAASSGIFVRFDMSRLAGAFCYLRSGRHESKGVEMTGNKRARHHGGAEGESARPDWRRLHHSRLFWVGLFMMLLAITIYVLSDDLAWRPRLRQ
jgi:hypothetical protein